jgi:mannose-6-phosphate isomerase-like protein (cupin superfamily)
MDNRTSGTATREARTLDRAMTVIDPREAASQLRGEPAWQRDDRASVTLLHDDTIRIVLTSLHEGATLGADVSDDWACMDLLEGSATVARGSQETRLRAGQRVVLAPGEAWSFEATQEPTLVLSTFTPDRLVDGG